ncbi:FAD-binding domain-containing protein [Rhexocercosporidium sp. MPI-PUGE-AT-0058]|nr:FAD-binding domain-containing protein [Rhexocercosporidium sp. MPI-PUGE-AT-0058]
MTPKHPIIIIGGGVVGLTLAQALKKNNIPFEIYERDTQIDRSTGWGITIHWALPALRTCLSPELYERLATIQVDPQQGIRDTGRFLFLDLATAEPVYQIPPSERLRVNRLKLRALLAEGVDVRWGKYAVGFDADIDGGEGVKVVFSDGTSAIGSVLIGADGSGSKIRRVLLGESVGKLNQLPVRFMGVTVRLTPEEVEPLRSIDPLLFQGSHRETGTFLWYSTLSTPEVNGSSSGEAYYEGQLNISWIVRSEDDEVPTGNQERIMKMKSMAKVFEARLRKVVEDIPDDSAVLEIKLQDWPTVKWPNFDGKLTLVGDAAHAMTMYRGEAANHGFTDAARLSEQLIAMYRGEISQKNGIEEFEAEMMPRTHDAVLLSRQACLDAHDLNKLKPESPLVSKRAKVLQPATLA